MNPNCCNWNIQSKWNPDFRMIVDEPIKYSGFELNYNLSNDNMNIYKDYTNCNYVKVYKKNCNKNNIVNGGGGFFGEVKGSCGWKKRGTNDCCWTKCKPAWKTQLYPFKAKL